MATKNELPSADWNTVRDTPYLVGFATVLAGSSGLATVKELLALSLGIMENQGSNIPLIRDLNTTSELQAAQASIKQKFGGDQQKPTPEAMRQRALDQVQTSLNIIGKSCSKEETDAYRRMLYNIAEKVANAAREGGFLGFGGAQVSEGERSFLDELRNTMQLEQVKRA